MQIIKYKSLKELTDAADNKGRAVEQSPKCYFFYIYKNRTVKQFHVYETIFDFIKSNN